MAKPQQFLIDALAYSFKAFHSSAWDLSNLVLARTPWLDLGNSGGRSHRKGPLNSEEESLLLQNSEHAIRVIQNNRDRQNTFIWSV